MSEEERPSTTLGQPGAPPQAAAFIATYAAVEPGCPFWSIPIEELLRDLATDASQGLSQAEAAARQVQFGSNTLAKRKRFDVLVLLLRQFTNPIVLILMGAALLSFALHSPTDGIIT